MTFCGSSFGKGPAFRTGLVVLLSVIAPALAIAATHRASYAAPLRFGHLYLAQGADIVGRVYRYPLRADGFPSKNPDGVLNLPFRYPGGIAIGPDGDLYVSSSGTANGCKNESKCFVEVFAPGASGNAVPIRILYVPAQPQYIAVDQDGYLDVSVLRGPGVYVYAPGASGNDRPVKEIASGADALAASHGVAYIQTSDAVVGVPEHASGQPTTFLYPPGEGPSSNGVATDWEQLYAAYYAPFRPNGYQFYLAVGEYRLDRPGRPFRVVKGSGCRVSAEGGALGYGLAAYKHYLFEQCIDAGGPAGAVLVYDAEKVGWQAPLLELPGGNGGVAVGP
jgi:hypothetical protein